MRFLFLGDIVGRPGRHALRELLPELRAGLKLDAVLANGENASAGLGLTAKSADELLSAGIDLLTGGNHIWKYRDLHPVLEASQRLLRPLNYPDAPGRGAGVVRLPGLPAFAVLNVQGRVFMDPMDCPFRAVDAALEALPADVRIRIVDMHAEATSEKAALAWHLDGRVGAVLGTHTHVQTSDARILPQGTAFMTDLGMCGPVDSCLGMRVEPVLRRFLTGLPERFEVAGGPVVLHGALFDINEATGRAEGIEAWRLAVDDDSC